MPTELLRRLGAFGRPLDASAQGWRGDEIFGWITLVLFVLFAIVLLHLFGVLLVSRRTSAPSETRGDALRARMLVAFATLAVFLGVDGVALVRGGIDLDEGLLRTPRPAEKVVRVEVLAQQWAWSFRLAGEDDRFGTEDDIVTLHALRIPVGRPVLFELRSKDVIHSLYLPNFRIKRDAQPGVTTELLIEPTRTGRFEIACAQHCGLNHYKMRAELEVLDQASFSAWSLEESRLAKSRAAALASDGNWGWPFGEGKR